MPRPVRRGLTPDVIALIIAVFGLLTCIGSAQWLLSTHTPSLSIGLLLNSFSPPAKNAFFTQMMLLVAALTLGVHGVVAGNATKGFIIALRVIAALSIVVGALAGSDGFKAATLAAQAADLTIASTAPWHAGWLLLTAGGLVAASVALAFIPLIQARRSA